MCINVYMSLVAWPTDHTVSYRQTDNSNFELSLQKTFIQKEKKKKNIFKSILYSNV